MNTCERNLSTSAALRSALVAHGRRVTAVALLCVLLLACSGDDVPLLSDEAPSSLDQQAPPTAAARLAVKLRRATAMGSLCPAGLAAAWIADQGETATLVISGDVESQTGLAVSKKCTVALEIEVPARQQFTDARLTWHGYGFGGGMKATFQSSYAYAGSTERVAPRVIYASSLKDDDFDITFTTTDAVKLWSPCSERATVVTLQADISGALQQERSSSAFGFFRLSVLDVGLLSSTTSVKLRSCAGP